MAELASRLSSRRTFIARKGPQILLLVALAAVLQIAAGVGMGFWSGADQMNLLLGRFNAYWLGAMVVGLLVSFLGYYFVY